MRKAPVIVVLLAIAGGASLLGGVGPAGASFSPNPLPSPQTNGRVEAILRSGGIVYVGGAFSQVLDSSGLWTPRANVAAYDAATGALLAWDPAPNAAVHALAVDGPTIYLGGSFTSVAGQRRAQVAAVSAAGVLRPWSVAVDGGAVRALLVANNRVYLGGTFTAVNGLPRRFLASVRQSTGAVDRAFVARPDNAVWALRGSASRIYVGGAFRFINRRPASHIAALRYATGGLLPWGSHPYNAQVLALAQAHGIVYAGLAGNGGRIVAYTGMTGRRRWEMWLDGNVKAVAVAGGQLIAGGHFTNACAPGSGEPCRRPVERQHLLAARLTNGSLVPRFTPRLDSTLGVFALAGTPTLLYAGGDFQHVELLSVQHLATFGVPPTVLVRPAVSGQAVEGNTLSATSGQWTGLPPIATTLQWERCTAAPPVACTPVSGATGVTYPVTSDDAGFALRVVVTATNPAGTIRVASGLTAVVS